MIKPTVLGFLYKKTVLGFWPVYDNGTITTKGGLCNKNSEGPWNQDLYLSHYLSF